nr:M24 family metallopeptidase [uncultured Sphaerochaeta sp.]
MGLWGASGREYCPRPVFYAAFELADRLGLSDGFMGLGPNRCPFIGHGVGLELDEWPVFAKGVTEPLAENMTFALEPRYFLPEHGVVGLEDTFCLTPDGPEPLTITSRSIITVPM